MRALQKFKNKKTVPLLFFDIEVVRGTNELPQEGPLFDAWAYQRRKEEEVSYEDLAASYKAYAPLYAEFSKIVAASFGFIHNGAIVIKSFSDSNELELLTQIAEFLSDDKFEQYTLSSFAGKGYDAPVIARRMLANNIEIPSVIDSSDKKPWEISHIDLMELWKMNGFYPASLITVCLCLGIESPKDSIDGSMVSDVFYESEEGLSTIVEYCNRDVIATANIALRMMGQDIIKEYIVK